MQPILCLNSHYFTVGTLVGYRNRRIPATSCSETLCRLEGDEKGARYEGGGEDPGGGLDWVLVNWKGVGAGGGEQVEGDWKGE